MGRVVTVSKRLRYEILRRDNFACRYCGATAPSAKLTIDHVIAVALGGSDDASNLVTACADCNSGKSATPVEAPLVEDVAQDALRWARAMDVAAREVLADFHHRQRCYDLFDELWMSYGEIEVPRPADWRSSIDQFLAARVPREVVEEAVDIAMRSHVTAPRVWRYFCGVVWRKVDAMREIAADVFEAGD